MKTRPGFTLAELVIAVLIFGFMSTSLATIYSTANRHMFQNYRNNMIKSNVSLAMRDIRHNLQEATRVDTPAAGAGGNVLAFVVNVDQLTGCYPVNQAAVAGTPPTWHYFCTRADAIDPAITDLYHHTAAIPVNASWCGSSPTSFWGGAGAYPVPICGANIGGQTVTLIMQYSVPAAAPSSNVMFSRIAAAPDNVYERNAVLVTLRSRWIPAVAKFGASQRQREVDFTLASLVTINSSN
jgi:prepilin-type N-terminal cleavage/methylation domain-containing protein